MPPNRRGNAAPTDFDKSIVASIILHSEAVWETSPMKMPGWFYKLRKDAPTHDAAFDALLKHGYTTSRGKDQGVHRQPVTGSCVDGPFVWPV